MSKTLLDNQAKAIKKLQRYKVGALFMDTGTGKTRTCVELINSIAEADFVLFIAPYSAINPPDGVASIKDEVEIWGLNAPILFVGAESIGCSDRIYLDTRATLASYKHPVIVVDESIKIKNVNAKRTKRILEFSTIAEYKLIANATPVTRNLLDLWAQMEFLSPQILKMSYAEFENTFCVKTRITRRKNGKKQVEEYVSGYANIDYLYSIIGHYVYECDLNSTVLTKTEEVYFSLSDEEAQEYNEMKERFLNEEFMISKSNKIFMEMTQKMQAGYCLAESKMDAIKSIFKKIDSKRTAIYCKYIASKEFLRKAFPDSLILSYQKNATSINLQYDYDNIVFWEKTWDYYLVKQAKGRIDRVGREKPISYFALNANVGLDGIIDKCVAKKTSMAAYLKEVSIEQLKKDL